MAKTAIMKAQLSKWMHIRQQKVADYTIMTALHRADQRYEISLGSVRYQIPNLGSILAFDSAKHDGHHETAIYQ